MNAASLNYLTQRRTIEGRPTLLTMQLRESSSHG